MVILAEEDEAGAGTDRFLEKMFNREFPPVVGNTVQVGGNGYTVDEVYHDLDRDDDDDRSVLVYVPVSVLWFESLMAEDSSWSLRSGYIN